MSTAAQTITDLLFGRWRSRILYAGARLGVFDALQGEPRSAGEVAGHLEVDAHLLYRLMRALSAIGLLEEDDAHRFSLTGAGELLREDAEQSLKNFVLLQEGPEHYAIWQGLPEMVREGRQNGFLREFGEMAFDYAAHHAEYRAAFKRAMSSFSTVQSRQVLDALRDVDFSAIDHLCDIGGGQGHLLCSFLVRYPSLHGSVLDLPEVLENTDELWAPRMNVADRCHYRGGDMFRTVPAADAYLLKLILHDWNDEECVRILSRAREAAQPGARLFIVERIITPPGTAHFSKLYDIHMMCWGSGRERTEKEYAQLLENAGWRLRETRHTRDGQLGVIEARAH